MANLLYENFKRQILMADFRENVIEAVKSAAAEAAAANQEQALD